METIAVKMDYNYTYEQSGMSRLREKAYWRIYFV